MGQSIKFETGDKFTFHREVDIDGFTTPENIYFTFETPFSLVPGAEYNLFDFLREYDRQRFAAEHRQPVSVRRKLLEEAADLIDGDRNVQYGDPNADFKRIAQIWNAYLAGVIEKKWDEDMDSIMYSLLDPQDIAAMMVGLKLSRISWSPENEDSWKDIAGYSGCGWHCANQSIQEKE